MDNISRLSLLSTAREGSDVQHVHIKEDEVGVAHKDARERSILKF
jgi:hypothetical protein